MTNTNTTDRVAATIASADFAARVEAVRAAVLADETASLDLADIATNALDGHESAQRFMATYLLEREASPARGSHRITVR